MIDHLEPKVLPDNRVIALNGFNCCTALIATRKCIPCVCTVFIVCRGLGRRGGCYLAGISKFPGEL